MFLILVLSYFPVSSRPTAASRDVFPEVKPDSLHKPLAYRWKSLTFSRSCRKFTCFQVVLIPVTYFHGEVCFCCSFAYVAASFTSKPLSWLST